MRTPITACLLGLAAALLSGPRAASEEKAEWEDLFSRDLKDWSRTGEGKSPWRLSADRSTLTCAAGATEGYVPERLFADGTLKFEYRFRKTDRKEGYAAALSLRKRPAAMSGCKVALGDACGTLTATFQGGSDRVKTLEEPSPVQAAKPIGEWNEVVATLRGRTVSVQVNGKPVASFDTADTDKGLIVLEAEGSEVDFRNVKWQPTTR